MADLFELGSLYDPRKDPRYSDLISPSSSDFNFVDAWSKGTNTALSQEAQSLTNERNQRVNDSQKKMADVLANLPEGANVEDAIYQAAIEGADLDTIIKAQNALSNKDARDMVSEERSRKSSQAKTIAEILNNAGEGEDVADLLIKAGLTSGDPDLISKGESIKNSRSQQDFNRMMKEMQFTEALRKSKESEKDRDTVIGLRKQTTEAALRAKEEKAKKDQALMDRLSGVKSDPKAGGANYSNPTKTGPREVTVRLNPKYQATK